MPSETLRLIFDSGLAVGVIGLLLREISKQRSSNKQNGTLDEIRADLRNGNKIILEVKEGQVAIKEQIIGMKETCVEARAGFTKDISNNRKEILEIVKKGAGS